jgi:hypothetical protein
MHRNVGQLIPALHLAKLRVNRTKICQKSALGKRVGCTQRNRVFFCKLELGFYKGLKTENKRTAAVDLFIDVLLVAIGRERADARKVLVVIVKAYEFGPCLAIGIANAAFVVGYLIRAWPVCHLQEAGSSLDEPLQALQSLW